jgi:membrane associated rhomboid family serine protease
MIPIKDDNPRLRPPIVTVGLITANIVAFYFEYTLGMEYVVGRFGAVSADIVRFQNPETLITSMFLHGGFLHLGGNMLYLWIFGDNIEGYFGHFKFVIFYLLCGLLATATHIVLGGVSEVPLVGASGAISGVLGAYAAKYPKARVVVIIPLFVFITVRSIPAIIALGFWFAIQLVYGFLTVETEGGGVAFWAHVGGFVAGLLLVYVFPKGRRPLK